MDEDAYREELIVQLDRVLAQLSEHFDAIQINATRHVDGADSRTEQYNRGTGNWFARFGAVQMWVEEHKAREHDAVRRENNEKDY